MWAKARRYTNLRILNTLAILNISASSAVKSTSGFTNLLVGILFTKRGQKILSHLRLKYTGIYYLEIEYSTVHLKPTAMKHLFRYVPVFIISFVLLWSLSCTKKQPSFDDTVMNVYQPEELQKLIDNAVRIEMVGDPSVRKSENPLDSSVTTTTVQIYRVYVATKDDRLIPRAEVTDSVMQLRPGGPIVITSACEMSCNSPADGGSCNVEGCMPTNKCGCTQGSCGNNCTTDKTCRQTLAGFSFGGVIMF